MGGVLGVVAAFKECGSAGTKLLDQQQQMVNKGIQLNNVLGIQAEYFNKIAKAVPTIDAVGYLKTVQDLRGVLGSDSAAIAAAPQAAKIDTLLGEKSAYDVFRAFEKKGVTQDSEKQQQILNELYPYLQLFKEKVKAGDVSNFATRAGAAWITTDLAKTAPYLLPLIADLRGDTAGVTMNQLHKFIQGGAVLSKQQTEALESLGLIDMTKAHKTGFGGGKTQLDIGAIKDSLKYASDDPGWVRNVLQPAIEA
jgi:hypothetical protein